MLTRDRQIPFERKIKLIAAAGVDLPAEIAALKDRLRDFQRSTAATPLRDRLADAITAGDTKADLPLLWAGALAESLGGTEVFETVRLRVNRRIREVYSEAAPAAYAELAQRFNTDAQAMTAAAALVDPETPAEAVVDSPEKIRRAWADAADRADAMTALLPALGAAATLAGICDDDPDLLLPLTVDPGDCHRRHLWHAWETDTREDQAARTAERAPSPFTIAEIPRTRTRRWGALLRLGVTLRAADEPVDPYRRPKPMVERMVNEPGGPKRIILDPEDPDYTEPAPEVFTAPRNRIRVSS